jgi:hypothetical protein
VPFRVAKHERNEQKEQSALRKQWCRKALATAMRDMERPRRNDARGDALALSSE